MTNTESVWARICGGVKERVAILNQNGQQLTFRDIGNGFQIRREAPYLAVERWKDGDFIFGSSRFPGAGSVPAMFPPVFIRDGQHGGVVLEQDGRAVTTDAVVQDAVKKFTDPLEK
jgi:hypothetical protein